MGCCETKETDSVEGTERSDATDPRNRPTHKSNDSLLITVLWRRISLFSRRDSRRSSKRHSVQSQKLGNLNPENAQDSIKEESEKG